MKLAIVGSTMLAGNPEVEALIERLLDQYQPTVVVSGGAAGVDTMAEQAAMRRGIETDSRRPTVRRWAGPGGFQERNTEIAERCDRLVRIACDRSKTFGSGWTMMRTASLGKPTEEYVFP